jgi:hypothetical protein
LKRNFIVVLIHLLVLELSGQVYTEKQTRHRFAQMTTGFDFQTSIGGQTHYIDAQGAVQSLEISPLPKARLLIGGTHFWGHADFYIAIPLFTSVLNTQEQEIVFSSGVEQYLNIIH